MLLRFFIIFGLLAFFPGHADVLYLKNGRSFEGEVLSENAKSVTFREQGLTLTFKRSKISHIEKKESPPATPTSPASRSREPPRAFIGFFEQIRKLESAHLVNLRAKSEIVKLQRSIDTCIKQETVYETRHLEARARTQDARSNREYTEYTRTANDYYAKILEKREEISDKKKKLTRTQQSLNRYPEQAMAIRADYERRFIQYVKDGQDPAFTGYFEYIHSKLDKHTPALSATFQTFKGNALRVQAYLNNKATGTFIVDTGATIVLLHKSLAQKLGIKLDGPKQDVILADGSTAGMTPVTLKSITVNGMTAFNVAGAVSELPPGHGVDGLLGMSFLSQFDFQLDIQRGRLLLNTRN